MPTPFAFAGAEDTQRRHSHNRSTVEVAARRQHMADIAADNENVIIALGDPGAGVAGVRTHVVLPGATARRWFTDLIGQLHNALNSVTHRYWCSG